MRREQVDKASPRMIQQELKGLFCSGAGRDKLVHGPDYETEKDRKGRVACQDKEARYQNVAIAVGEEAHRLVEQRNSSICVAAAEVEDGIPACLVGNGTLAFREDPVILARCEDWSYNENWNKLNEDPIGRNNLGEKRNGLELRSETSQQTLMQDQPDIQYLLALPFARR